MLYIADMTKENRIREARMKIPLTQQQLADAVGVSAQSVSQWERGETEPAPKHRSAIASALRADIRWLFYWSTDTWMEGDRIPVDTRVKKGSAAARQQGLKYYAPLVNRVTAGQWAEVVDPQSIWNGPEELLGIDSPPLIRPTKETQAVGQYMALEVDGESMEPEFQAGDIIIVDTGIEPIPGDFVVAKLDEEHEATFKKYRPRGKDDKGNPVIELTPLNPDYPSLTLSAASPGRVIGTMVEHRRFRAKR